MELFLAVEAKFAGGAVGAESAGQVEDGAGAGGDGGVGAETAEGEEAGGLVEGEAGAELAGSCAENSAAEGRIEGAEAVEFDGDGGLAWGGADSSATASDGFAREEELGEKAVEF
jgi:hypothetical protein